LLLLGLAPDELLDAGVFGVEDDHFGGAAGFAAGLDDAGEGVAEGGTQETIPAEAENSGSFFWIKAAKVLLFQHLDEICFGFVLGPKSHISALVSYCCRRMSEIRVFPRFPTGRGVWPDGHTYGLTVRVANTQLSKTRQGAIECPV
jgi:hypothetical protein